MQPRNIRWRSSVNQLWKGSGHWSLRANVFIATETPLLLSWSCSDSWTCKRFMLISLLYIGGIRCRGMLGIYLMTLQWLHLTHIYLFTRIFILLCLIIPFLTARWGWLCNNFIYWTVNSRGWPICENRSCFSGKWFKVDAPPFEGLKAC